MKHLAFFAILVAGTINSTAQTTFQNTFGSSNGSQFNDVVINSDGTYVGVMATNDYDMMMMTEATALVKMDANGDTLWTSAFDDGGMLSMVPNSIDTTSDGGYIVAGDHGGASLTKLDATGTVEWSKQYAMGTGATTGKSAHQTPDGGYLLAGGAFVSGSDYEFYLVKTDANGDTLWTNHYGTSEREYLENMILTSDGGCMLVGYRSLTSSTNEYSALSMKIDGTGNLEYSKTYHSNWSDFHHIWDNLIETSDGGFVFVGRGFNPVDNFTFPFAMKTDALGNAIWKGDYRDVFADFITVVFNGVDETPSGDLIAVGRSSWLAGSVSITKMNGSTGVAEWREEYTSPGNDEAHAVKVAADGSIIVVGSGGFNNPYNGAYAIKTDSNGIAEDCFRNSRSVGFPSSGSNSNLAVSATNFGGTINSISYFEHRGIELHRLLLTLDIDGSDPLCHGDCNGSATVSVSDGQGPYSYLWSTGGNLDTEIGLCPSTFYVTVTDDVGCSRLDSVSLSEPSQLQLSSNVNHVSCFGAYDGAIDISVSGGTPGYSYLWPTQDTTEDISGLSGGFYQVSVTDTNGCEANTGVIVQEPQQLVTVISGTVNASCNGVCDGELNSITLGGTSPYTFQWNDPLAQTTFDATGLCVGQYLLTVTDDNGCVALANGTITEPAPLTLSVSTEASECFASNGSADAMVSGGTSPYQYSWNGAAASAVDSVENQAVGSYVLDVTDDNGCTIQETYDINSFTTPVEICVVSVDTSMNKNLIVWEKPQVTNIQGFYIYRNIAGAYSQVGYQPYDSISQYVDTDFGVDPQITSYRYKISVLDSCGNESALSDFHETIHLTSSLGVSNEVNLIWDDYEGVAFNEYEIYRDTTNIGNWELIGTVLSTNFTFVDNTVPLNATTLRYSVEVVLPSTCSAEKAQDHNSTRSNRTLMAGPGAVTSVETNILEKAKVVPNPGNGLFTIWIGAQEWSYELFDLSGKRILGEENNTSMKQPIDIRHLESGVYLLKLEVNGQSSFQKVVKQ